MWFCAVVTVTIMNYNVLLNYDVKQYTYTTFEYCEILFSCEETILPFLLIRTSRNKTISIFIFGNMEFMEFLLFMSNPWKLVDPQI